MEHVTDAVAERVAPIMELEYRRLPENERLAAIEAVQETFEQAPLDNDDLFATDLDARHLDRHLRQCVPDVTRDLSTDGAALYGRERHELHQWRQRNARVQHRRRLRQHRHHPPIAEPSRRLEPLCEPTRRKGQVSATS